MLTMLFCYIDLIFAYLQIIIAITICSKLNFVLIIYLFYFISRHFYTILLFEFLHFIQGAYISSVMNYEHIPC